ncbi:hypothetical protein [Jatrophihabitans sp.]|uniref:hypothetical protein n=1 Tax=Jatrophihabitans sp. TaxID=1932789 RepID=UPI002D1AA641|nr:hypothetical protein [Jatrophihabitans sp.]
MRALLSSSLAACAATVMLAPAADAAPAAQLQIERNTSAIYQYDPSPFGDGPLFDTVNVSGQLRNCPAGDYLVDVTLVQNGVSYPWATTALGAGELTCTATNTRPKVGMAFYGNGLHPGTAQATITVYRQVDGMPVLAKTSRTVRIPAGYNQPG